jgi:hypothetical protein
MPTIAVWCTTSRLWLEAWRTTACVEWCRGLTKADAGRLTSRRPAAKIDKLAGRVTRIVT